MASELVLNEIETVVFDELNSELSVVDADNYKPDALKSKIKSAYREVCKARNYPVGYADEDVLKDMESFIGNIKNIALFDYNQIGAEFQESYSDSTASRRYERRNSLFVGVIPIARV